jgi:hypothetical protein
MMGRGRAVWFIVALGLGLRAPARAVPLQSDDFQNGLASFWKVHQILRDTDAGTYGPAKAEASGGTLKMTSESDDIWFKKFQPFLVYQENITGAFDIRIQAISNDGSDSWSGAGGLMLLQSVPDKVIEADPTTYPSHWMIDATNGHGPEDKGGGQAQSRENERLDLGTGTPLQPPYWLRMLRIGDSLSRYYSIDGGKSWVAAGPRVDLAHIRSWTADNLKPIKDPVAVGIVQQAHDKAGNPVTAVLGPFQATAVPTGTLTGVLCDLNAEPLPHATFRAIATPGTVIPVGTDIPIMGDSQGEFSVELAPGTYTLTTDAAGRALAGFPMTVTVTAGQTTGLGIVFGTDMPPFLEDGAGSRVQDDFAGTSLNGQWTNADVGTAAGSGGAATVSNGVVSIAAGGSGVTTDNVAAGYNGTFLKVFGDFAATVQVLAVPDNQDNEFGGLVATTGTDPFAAFALNLITPRHPIEQWVRPIAAADPIATPGTRAAGGPNTQGSTLLPAWLKIRRVGDTVAYWWTKDPTQGTPVFGGIDQLDDFAAKELLVGLAAGAAVTETSVDAGFKFAHFRLVSVGE